MKPLDDRTGTITSLRIVDVRFPTSRNLDGSDAMNLDPDYSAAYVILGTDRGDSVEGHGLTFTIGRGTEVVVAGVEAIRPLVVGQPLAAFTDAPGELTRRITTGDSQLRWLGPEKGVMQLASAAVVNALWDLWAKIAGQPLWKLLADLSPDADRGARRLALPDRCAHPGRGAPRARSPGPDARSARGGAARDRLPGVHHLGRLARLPRRRRSGGSAARRSAPGSPASKSKLGRTAPTTSGARRWCARRSARAAS